MLVGRNFRCHLLLGKRVGKTFDKARGIQRVQDACDFGSQAHEEIEYFLKEGTDIIHPSLKFVQEFIEKRFPVSSFRSIPCIGLRNSLFVG